MNKSNSTRNYEYFIGELDNKRILDGMRKYVIQKQELDKFLEKIISPYILDKKLKILDACCGIGHLIGVLKDLSPNSRFIGIDNTPYLIEEAKKIMHQNNIEFEQMDVYKLSEHYGKDFDISLNWKTISWLPDYKDIIKELFKVTKKHIFLSSLFYDGDIDFEIKVKINKSQHGRERHPRYYNVYSYPAFKKFCYGIGAKRVTSHDFEIAIDLPKPPPDQMGTYTLKLENRKRLQVSGAVIMLWKVIQIDLE